jgi:hypothetical protein
MAVSCVINNSVVPRKAEFEGRMQAHLQYAARKWNEDVSERWWNVSGPEFIDFFVCGVN